MAAQLKLVMIDDAMNDVDSVDLSPYLADDGWEQVVADVGVQDVEDAMTLHIKGASIDHLKTSVAALYAKRRIMTNMQGPLHPMRVVLRAQLDRESQARQAFVSQMKFGNARTYGKFISQNVLETTTMGVTRTAAWESPTERIAFSSYIEGTNLDALGGKWQVSVTGTVQTVYGDLPARIRRTYIYGDTPNLNYVYAGWKSNRYTSVFTQFEPFWNLRKGSAFGADTTGGTTNPDATAKDGYRVNVTFATVTTMAERVRIKVSDIMAANRDAAIGQYKVLLRAKIGSGGMVCNARIGEGYTTAAAAFAMRPRVQINKPFWHLYDMGNISLPSTGGGAFLDQIANAGLSIEVEKVSGAGGAVLYLDGVILIPLDDGMLHIYSGAGMGTTGGSTNVAYVEVNPDRTVRGNIHDTANIKDTFIPSVVNWAMPLGSPLLVVAGCPGSGSTVDDGLNVLFGYHERWLTLRGADV